MGKYGEVGCVYLPLSRKGINKTGTQQEPFFFFNSPVALETFKEWKCCDPGGLRQCSFRVTHSTIRTVWPVSGHSFLPPFQSACHRGVRAAASWNTSANRRWWNEELGSTTQLLLTSTFDKSSWNYAPGIFTRNRLPPLITMEIKLHLKLHWNYVPQKKGACQQHLKKQSTLKISCLHFTVITPKLILSAWRNFHIKHSASCTYNVLSHLLLGKT